MTTKLLGYSPTNTPANCDLDALAARFPLPGGGRTVAQWNAYQSNLAALIWNVKDFGALGDGSTDDTVAINLAFTTLAARGGGTLLFPAGTYRVTNNLYGGARVTMQGQGRGATTIYQTGVNLNVLYPANDMQVLDLTLKGAWDGAGVPAGPQNGLQPLYLGGSFPSRGTTDAEWAGIRLVMERVTVTNMTGNGVSGLAPFSRLNDVTVQTCYGEGILISGDRCQLSNINIDGVGSWGVDFNCNRSTLTNFTITNTGNKTVYGDDAGGLCIVANVNVGSSSYNVVSGGNITQSGYAGILVISTDNTGVGLAQQNLIEGVTVGSVAANSSDNALGGICISNANGGGTYPVRNTTVSGCTVLFSSKTGISVRSTLRTTIVGCNVAGTLREGILVESQLGTQDFESKVVDSVLTDFGYEGIKADTLSRKLNIGTNTLSNKTTSGAGKDLPLISLGAAYEPSIHGNILEGTNGASASAGIVLTGDCADALVENNVVTYCSTNCDVSGLGAGSLQVIVRNNTLTHGTVADLALSVTGSGNLAMRNLLSGGDTDSGMLPLVDAATIAVNALLAGAFTVTLGGNRTVGLPTNPTQGKRITFLVAQDGTGGRTLAWNAAFITSWSDTGNTAGKMSSVEFVFNNNTAKWVQVGAQRAYA